MRGVLKSGLVLLIIALLAVGVSACGDDDSGSTTSAEAQREAQAEANAEVKAHNAEVMKEYKKRNAAAAPTEDEQEARESASDFYAILDEDEAPRNLNKTTVDSEAFCDLMSEQAQTQTVHYAKVSSGIQQKWDCESAVDLLVIRSKRTGGFKGVKSAKVIGANAQGDRATATVQFGNGPATSIPLVKEDGEWKLAANPVSSKGASN
jgi:hypothetical protein